MTTIKREIAKRFKHLFQEIRQELPLAEYIAWWLIRAILLGGAVWSIFYSPDKTFEMFISVALSFCIPFLHLIFMNLWPGHFPIRMQTVGTVYLLVTSFCGSLVGLYYLIPWWDLALHTTSGIVLVYVGYCIVSALNYKHRPRVGDPAPVVLATCGAGFSAFASLVWEVMEFVFDSVTLGDSQHWRVNPDPGFELFKTATAPELIDFFHVDAGRYALLDTMTDIICGLIGAVIGFVVILCWLRRRDRAGLLQHGVVLSNGPECQAERVEPDDAEITK